MQIVDRNLTVCIHIKQRQWIFYEIDAFMHYHFVDFHSKEINDLLFIFLQCLEQEKHILRRKLSEAESERDLRVQELESDYNDLKSKLMSQVI